MMKTRGIGALGVCFLVWVGAGPAFSKVVISEFRTRGPAGGNDEFIELYNTGPNAVDIGGYKIKGSSAAGAVSVRATIPPGTVMGPRTFYLIVNTASSGYSGPVPGDLSYTLGIADNGGLALTDAADVIVDAVGMSTGSVFKEGTPLPPFSSTNKEQSYERKTATCGPDQDTDDNAADFQYNDGSSKPQNALSCRPACAGERCVSPPEPFCRDAGTSVLFGLGRCVAGQCLYDEYQEIPCEFGCDPATGLCQEDPCAGVVCDNPPNTQCFEMAGTCVDGLCVYLPLPEETSCDDGDLCTATDECNGAGQCLGSPILCYPPSPLCLDRQTSRFYIGGSCDGTTGECVFSHVDTTCAFGCDPATGVCANDPCAGVVCDNPPNKQCYGSVGTCVAGSCEYPPLAAGTLCDDANPCTVGDQCDGQGACEGFPKVCNTPPNTKCYGSVGVCVGGSCQYEAFAVGTPCDDGDLCTVADACDEGRACWGVPKVCETPPPVCQDRSTSRIELDLACFPQDGICRGNLYLVDCGVRGCDETFGMCNRLPIISQFRTRGPAGGNDEFVEVFNPSSLEVNIGGWTLRGSSPTGTTNVRATVPPGTVMKPRTFYLFVNTSSSGGYSGAVAGDQGYGTGISDTGGVALVDPAGNVVDAVGMSSGSAYLEGIPLAPLSLNQDQAYERKTLSCGPDRDLDDNVSDFAYLTASHPRNSASCRPACAGDRCVSGPAPSCQDSGTLWDYPVGICTDAGLCEYPLVLVPCEFGCEQGACNPDPCEGVVCNDPPNDQCFESTGTCSQGVCSYEQFDAGTECDDANHCTVMDSCSSDGQCLGKTLQCEAKGPECLDEKTSRSYSPGKCVPSTGECVYEASDRTCDFGCDAVTGLCLGDPCAGVVCDDSPSQCHVAQGTCSGGVCSYALLPKGEPCDDGDPCTKNDACDGTGGCAGTPLVCDRAPGPCFLPSGECVDGDCVYFPLSQGAPCDDLDPCTADDRCNGAGVCVGTLDPSCVPPEGGEDVAPGDAGPTPDDGAASDLTAGAEEVLFAEDLDAAVGPDAAPGDLTHPSDTSPGHDAIPDTSVADQPATDIGGDATPPKKKGRGSCSSFASPTSGWWIPLAMFGLWGVALRRKRVRP